MGAAVNYLVMLGAAIFVVTFFIVTVCIMVVVGYICLLITIRIIKRLEKYFEKKKRGEDL